MILKDWIRLERRGPTLVLWATVILGREETKSLAQDLGKMGWEMIIRMKYKESHSNAGLGRGDGACRRGAGTYCLKGLTLAAPGQHLKVYITIPIPYIRN